MENAMENFLKDKKNVVKLKSILDYIKKNF